MANFMQVSVSLPKLQYILLIIKISISKYILLCVEAGFSQIQSLTHTPMYTTPTFITKIMAYKLLAYSY